MAIFQVLGKDTSDVPGTRVATVQGNASNVPAGAAQITSARGKTLCPETGPLIAVALISPLPSSANVTVAELTKSTVVCELRGVPLTSTSRTCTEGFQLMT